MDFTKIIPPPTRLNREGFNNEPLVDELSQFDKQQLEEYLIQLLISFLNKDYVDDLIIHTLVYIKSNKSLPYLYDILFNINSFQKIFVASGIYEICKDPKMASFALEEFNKFKLVASRYSLGAIFLYLGKFNLPEINNVISEYTSSEDVIIRQNAKRALHII